MKKKIAFVEPFRHYEVLAALLRLVEGAPFEILCFCTDFCKAQMPAPSGVQFYTVSEATLDDPFLYRHLVVLNDCSHIFFTTINIHSTFFFEVNAPTQLLGLVHNSHNFFFYKTQKSTRRIRHLFHWIRGDFRKIKQIRARLDRIVVPSFSIERYIRQRSKSAWLQKLVSIEIAVPNLPAVVQHQPEIVFTIPGTINQDRRDYKGVFSVLASLDIQIKNKVKLYFLGKPFSKKEQELLRSATAQKWQNIELITFADYVAISDFQHILEKTDFLLLPIQQRIGYKALVEERGTTCVSGNINDITQFALPAILPAFYPLAPELETFVHRYDTMEELLERLVSWINHRSFDDLKNRHDLGAYKRRIREQFIPLFSE